MEYEVLTEMALVYDGKTQLMSFYVKGDPNVRTFKAPELQPMSLGELRVGGKEETVALFFCVIKAIFWTNPRYPNLLY
jgi:hypothetical protein